MKATRTPLLHIAGAAALAAFSLEASTWGIEPVGMLGWWLYLLPDLTYLTLMQPAPALAPLTDTAVYFAQSLVLVLGTAGITSALRRATSSRMA